MLTGTVIFVHQDAAIVNSMMNMLMVSSPCVHLERTTCGTQALTMQAMMRADAVVMGMTLPDMSGMHLLSELKRDIVDPYVMVCAKEASSSYEKDILKIGANSVVHPPVDIVRACGQIEAQLDLRGRKPVHTSLEETMLQRVFMDYGISCSMNGYTYLKCALRLLCEGKATTASMSMLYEMIALRCAGTPKNVERSIRYAIERCWERRNITEKRPGNREFLVKLMEECRGGRQTIIRPRVSILTSGRRVFR